VRFLQESRQFSAYQWHGRNSSPADVQGSG
jgi:hypothetical protein